jgi:hypothetical protein
MTESWRLPAPPARSETGPTFRSGGPEGKWRYFVTNHRLSWLGRPLRFNLAEAPDVKDHSDRTGKPELRGGWQDSN